MNNEQKINVAEQQQQQLSTLSNFQTISIHVASFFSLFSFVCLFLDIMEQNRLKLESELSSASPIVYQVQNSVVFSEKILFEEYS